MCASLHDDGAAVDVGRDPATWARALRRAYARAAGGATPSTIVRTPVAESWQRCAGAGVNVTGLAPWVSDPVQTARALARHPLAPHVESVADLLVDVARFAHQIVLVSDATGLILWAEGHEPTLAAAERIHLMPGTRWLECGAGTNAIGTALELDQPVQIFSAEHFRTSLHGWSSSAAPVHDPVTGATVGTVALAGPYRAAHPNGLSLVNAAAGLVEARFERLASNRRERLTVEFLQKVLPGCAKPSALVDRGGRVLAATPTGWLGSQVAIDPDGRLVAPPNKMISVEALGDAEGFLVTQVTKVARPPVLRLDALGVDRALAWLDGRPFRLTMRHSELLVILTLQADGVDEVALADRLYGGTVKAVTVRAEVSRLRKLMGPVVLTRPYRLVADVRADFETVARGLPVAADVAPLLARYTGPLLPSSKAPAVIAARRSLERAVRTAREGLPADMPALGPHASGDVKQTAVPSSTTVPS